MKNNVRQIIQLGYIWGTQGEFSDKVILDIDGFTNEPVVQCNLWVVRNTFVDDSKQIKWYKWQLHTNDWK